MSGQWKAFAGVALVFLLGCLAGGFGTSAFFVHRTTAFFQRGAPAYMELLEHRLSRGISLDANQQTQIHDIFMHNLEERKRLQAQIQPQIQSLNHETLHQVQAVLHPDQLEIFQKNLTELHRRFSRFGLTNSRAAEANSPAGSGNPATNAAPANPPAGP